MNGLVVWVGAIKSIVREWGVVLVRIGSRMTGK